MKNEILKRIISSIILLPLVLFFVIKGSYLFNSFLIICLILTFYEWHLMSKGRLYYLPGLVFILISFYYVYLLRNNDSGEYILFLLILLICTATDIGGYVFGKTFKGPKLTKISPNKTYSGMFGGFFLSVISCSIFLNYNDYYIIIESDFLSFFDFIFIIFISFLSQLGDIIISFFKRKSKIKNTGKIIPGHGGLLDRIDGMIFAFPSTYLILKIIYP